MKRLVFLLLLFSFVLSSCEKEEEPIVPTTSQTVLMYFPWSTDLLSFFEKNISDMESVIAKDILKKERVLVFLSTSQTKAKLFELKYEDGACVRVPLKGYVSLPITTSPGITTILEDVKTFAPAHRYAMTIGCHGLGWVPVPKGKKGRIAAQKYHWDYDGPIMTRYYGGKTSDTQTDVTTLATAITDAGIKMEYILFDDCYMSSIEVAYDLKEVTDHLIACPTEIMAYGMPYAEIGSYLLGKVDYEGICNAFLAFYENYSGGNYGTIGITVCPELNQLATIMKEINAECTFDPSLRKSIQRMDGYSPVLFFDYGDYMAKLCTGRPDLLAKFNAQLELAVPSIYRKHTAEYFSGIGGVIKINTYSGITTSDPSINSDADTKEETAWYQATH